MISHTFVISATLPLVFLLCLVADTTSTRINGVVKEEVITTGTNDNNDGGYSDSDKNNRHHYHKSRIDGNIRFEKAITCNGGMVTDKGGLIGCTGGLKSDFRGKIQAEEIADHLATHIKGQVQETFMGEDWLFYPDDDAWNVMETYDDDSFFLENLEDGHEKEIAFGGFVGAAWGCKVTLKKNGDNVEKHANCGLEFHKGHGQKPRDDELDILLAE